jgi:tetratricopeptide (TPR) repeat protein
MQAAQQQDWTGAQRAFEKGHELYPKDARFPTELAGVAFKQKLFQQALDWLKIARRLNPDDQYINNFLGSVFYLTGNRYAALNAWNRAGKPILANVRTEPLPRLDPVILDRAFAFAPGDQLTSARLLTTEARLAALNVFSKFDFYIAARQDGKFDATLYDTERNGFGRNKWDILLSTFGGLPAYTVTPSYYNVRGTGTNIQGRFRFDPEKRRGTTVVEGPLWRNPRWHYSVGGDYRNENWNVRNFSSVVTGSQLGSLNMRRSAASASIESIESGRWNWTLGGEYSYRDFRSVTGGILAPNLLLQGSQLKQVAQINYEVLRRPEHHLIINSSGDSQLGRIWANGGAHTFYKIQGSIGGDWFPNRSGDDYEIQQRFSAGHTAGDVPFDELFLLGLDADNKDLLMRAHVGTDKQRKGNAPLGRDYFLSNWELDKNAYSNGLFRVTIGPFLDTGKITDPLPYLGTREWLWDTGGQVKLKAFGMQFIVVYGKNLRTGDNTGYVYLVRH